MFSNRLEPSATWFRVLGFQRLQALRALVFMVGDLKVLAVIFSKGFRTLGFEGLSFSGFMIRGWSLGMYVGVQGLGLEVWGLGM